MGEEKIYYSANETARLLHRCRKSVTNYLGKGLISGLKDAVSGKLLIDSDSVKRFMAERFKGGKDA
jgi:hypothetical protein